MTGDSKQPPHDAGRGDRFFFEHEVEDVLDGGESETDADGIDNPVQALVKKRVLPQ